MRLAKQKIYLSRQTVFKKRGSDVRTYRQEKWFHERLEFPKKRFLQRKLQVLLFWQLVSFGKMPLFSLKLGRDSLIDCEHTEYLLPSMNFSLQKKHLESKMYLKRPQMVQFTSISYFFVCKIIKKKIVYLFYLAQMCTLHTIIIPINL